MSATKNLGLIRAIQEGITPPGNTALLWYDTNVGQLVHKYFNTLTSTWDTLRADAVANAFYGETIGTGVYTTTLVSIIASYQIGAAYKIKFVDTNSIDNPTININGLGAKDLILSNGVALEAGDIVAGAIYWLIFDGANLQVLGVSDCTSPFSFCKKDEVGVRTHIKTGEILAIREEAQYIIYGSITIDAGGTLDLTESGSQLIIL